MSRTKMIYFLSAFVLIIGCFALSKSYSLFVDSKESSVLSSNIPSLSYELTENTYNIPAYSEQIITLEVNNTGTSGINYAISIPEIPDGIVAKLVDKDNNNIVGNLSSSSSQNVLIHVINTNYQDTEVKFDLVANYNTLVFDSSSYVNNSNIDSENKYVFVNNPPELASGMIPVVYDETSEVWVKADISSDWYDYTTQKWANAVTVYDCVPKGDINLDGVIDQTDADIVKAVYLGQTTDYSDEQLLERADIDSDRQVNAVDYGLIKKIVENNGNEYNLCVTSSDKRETYMTASPGTEIPMDRINAMWVWIPRYKYKIASNLGSSAALVTPPQVDVEFEIGISATGVTESVYKDDMSASSDATNSNYYTHPAFRNVSNIIYNSELSLSRGAWDEELTGIWVGKFETGTNDDVCAASTIDNSDNTLIEEAAINCKDVDPIIKPSVAALRHQDVSTQFLTSLKFAGGSLDSNGEVTFNGNTAYGLTPSTDTHMMKNTEWGAVAILSQSQYGKRGNNLYSDLNTEIYQNKSTEFITGSSNGTPGTSTTNTQCLYNDMTDRGNGAGACGCGASTTGNIYGIYDMSGGSFEYVMGNWKGLIGFSNELNSGFIGPVYSGDPVTNGVVFPMNKYFDLYTGNTSSSTTTLEKSIMGDATWETMYWYSDSNVNSVFASSPWYLRGCTSACSTNSGVFNMLSNSTYGKPIYNTSFRTILIP